MEYRELGRTGLAVSRLGLGGLFVSKVGGPYEQARAAVHRAIELGINYLDTAPGYLDSEEVLGRALADVDAPLVLSTKLGGRPQPFNAQDPDQLYASFEESLRLLGRDYVDMLIIHEPDRPGQYDWWADKASFDGPVMDVLAQLRDQGRIGYLGLGGTTAYELARIIRTGKFDVVLTAFNYSLLWREAEIEVLPAAVEQGMGIIAGSPLQQGALSRRYDDQVRHGAPWLSKPRREQYLKLYALLDELEMPIAELAMRFVLSNPAVDTVLTGARSALEVEQNVATLDKGPLPSDVLARLDEIAAMVPFRPFEEPFGLPFGRPYAGPGPAA
ncbi:MAG: aldo/keto reductase [Anaerolineae bacterium]|jgi:aryl-alcohol dehydrogenase-like predicted oxidoreductase